jgi:hypothetical protein
MKKDCPYLENSGQPAPEARKRQNYASGLSSGEDRSDPARRPKYDSRKPVFRKSRPRERDDSQSPRPRSPGRRFSGDESSRSPGRRPHPPRPQKNRPPSPYESFMESIPRLKLDRDVVEQRKRRGQCLACGSDDHKLAECPKLTPQRDPRPQQGKGQEKRKFPPKPRVGFSVHEISEEPLSSGREGDEASDTDEAVDAFMSSYAVRAIHHSQPAAPSTWGDSDYE